MNGQTNTAIRKSGTETNVNTRIINFEFEQKSRWISKQLNDPKADFISYKNRDVYIDTVVGTKKIVIPSKENITQWRQAWLDVFSICLYAIQMKVNKLYRIGKFEGIIEEKSNNEVRVGNKIIKIPSNHQSVEYAKALEKIIESYNSIKMLAEEKRKNNPVSVKVRHITIDNPGKAVADVKTNIKTVSLPKHQEANNPIPKIINFETAKKQEANHPMPKIINFETAKKQEPVKDNHRVNTVRMAMVTPEEKPKAPKMPEFKIPKIPMNVSIDRNDCDKYRQHPLIIATCTNVKNGDGIYRDNIEMLKTNIPSASIGSFISGKASTKEQAAKEATRMLKLLNDCEVSRLVIYEVNNDYINEHLDQKEKITEIVESVFRICDVLSDGGYYPILCMDLETLENIKTVIPNFKARYHIIKCITPKQKDLVTQEDDILYMNPNSDNDVIMVSNSIIQSDFQAIPKKTVRESYSMAA